MRCGCYLLLAAIGLSINGGQGVYEWSQNRQQKVVSLEQFVAQKPSVGWFKVTNCVLDVQDAMWTENFGSVDDIYIPVHSANDPKNPKTSLLLEVHDEKLSKVVKDLAKMENEGAKDAEFLKYLLQHAGEMTVKRDIEGTIKFGIDDLQSKEHRKIAALDPNLDPSFAVMLEGGRPSLGWSLLKMLGGLLGVGLILLSMAKSGNDDDDTTTAAPGTSSGSNSPTNGPLGQNSPFNESV